MAKPDIIFILKRIREAAVNAPDTESVVKYIDSYIERLEEPK